MPGPDVRIVIAAQEVASQVVDRVRGRFEQLKSAALSLRGVLAGVGVSLGAAQVVDWLVSTNREYERFLAQLATTEGSYARGRAVFADIERFAMRTPFQLEELVESFIALRTVGITPTEDLLNALGDQASAFGGRINELAGAVRMAATGEMEQLKRFGVVGRVQGDQIRLTFRNTSVTVAREANAIVGALQKIAEQNFAGAMDREMQTLNGAISNLEDNLAGLARQIGEAGLTAALTDVTAGVEGFTGSVNSNRDAIAYWVRLTLDGVQAILRSLLAIPRVAFNVGQSIGELIGLLLAQFNWLVTSAVGLIIDGLNLLPGVEIGKPGGIMDPQRWLEEWAARMEGFKQHGADIYGVVAGIGRAWQDVAVSATTAARAQQAAAAAGGGLGGGGGGGGGGPRPTRFFMSTAAARAGVFGEQVKPSGLPTSLFPTGGAAPLSAEGISASLFVGLGDIGIEGSISRIGLAADFAALKLKQLEEEQRRTIEQTMQFRAALEEAFGSSLVRIFEEFGAALARTFQGIDGVFKGLLGTVVDLLGNIMIAAGTQIVLTSKAFQSFRNSLMKLFPEGGIGAGLALIAAGAFMKAGVSAFLSNPSGGSGVSGMPFSQTPTSLGGTAKGDAVVVLKGSWAAIMADPDAQDSFAGLIKSLTGRRVILQEG